METLSAQFDEAVQIVTVNGKKKERAQAAHTEVRELLEADPVLCEWGIDTILIGSYGRDTSRYPGKDVDAFLRFKNLTARHNPQKIYDEVERVLVAKYGLKEEGGRVTLRARSLNVDFSDSRFPSSDLSFSIDAVPAVVWGDHWGIPNRDRDTWGLDAEDKRWVKTDPVEFGEKTTELATATWSPTVGSRNAYRPVVRFMRQIRHVYLGEQKPGGLTFEVLTYYAWEAREVTGSSWAELVANTLAAVAKRLRAAAESGVPDPVLGTTMKPELDPSQWRSAAAVVEDLAAKAKQALEADKCRAAKLWREILGENDRGQILPLPPGCNANGLPMVDAAPVTAVGSDSARGFASR